MEGCASSLRICDPGVVALRRPAWQARDSVYTGAVFVGPVVQSARFGKPEACQNWSTSLWRRSPVLVLDVSRLDFVAGPALWMILSLWQACFA